MPALCTFNDRMLKDLAGNAFAAPVACAVLIATLAAYENAGVVDVQDSDDDKENNAGHDIDEN